MKRTSWLCWFFSFSVIYLSEAQYKFRRLQLPSPSLSRPPPQIFKKSWTTGSRISSMGNSIHIAGNLPHKRPPLIPTNYRFRRPPGPLLPQPPPMFNVLSNVYKSPIQPILGKIDTYGGMVQRVSPVNELQSIAKDPQPYIPQYQLKLENLSSNIDGSDDDKGPIHTIPAPNLGPASTSYQQQQQQQQYQQQALYNGQGTKREETVRKPYAVTQMDYAAPFDDHGSGEMSQRIISTNNNQHQYEVTELNEVNAVPSFYFTPDFNSAQYSSSDIEEQQTGENNVYLNNSPTPTSSLTNSHSSSIEPSTSMQTNLHSSMHVGVPGLGTAIGQSTYTSDLQDSVANPDDTSISTAKLYELINSVPRQLRDHYTSDQQLQMQRLPQQQNKQGDAVKTIFSQPTFHSFNFDEQANKQRQQQQQNIFVNQNYALGKVTADYSLAPDTLNSNSADTSEHQDNNIEFDNSATQLSPTSHFNKIRDHQNIAAQFYTTLPNQETAEKLAALAAAGIVNSHLIDHLKNQQQHASQQLKGQQSTINQSIPANHKLEHADTDVVANVNQSTKYSEHHPEQEHQNLLHRPYKIKEEQTRIEEEKVKYKQQSSEEKKRPLRIFVPEDNTEKEKDFTADYEYENDEVEVPRHKESSLEDIKYGTRIASKTGK